MRKKYGIWKELKKHWKSNAILETCDMNKIVLFLYTKLKQL